MDSPKEYRQAEKANKIHKLLHNQNPHCHPSIRPSSMHWMLSTGERTVRVLEHTRNGRGVFRKSRWVRCTPRFSLANSRTIRSPLSQQTFGLVSLTRAFSYDSPQCCCDVPLWQPFIAIHFEWDLRVRKCFTHCWICCIVLCLMEWILMVHFCSIFLQLPVSCRSNSVDLCCTVASNYIHSSVFIVIFSLLRTHFACDRNTIFFVGFFLISKISTGNLSWLECYHISFEFNR